MLPNHQEDRNCTATRIAQAKALDELDRTAAKRELGVIVAMLACAALGLGFGVVLAMVVLS